MSRTAIPYTVRDISALARSLREELTRCDHMPGHVELLNILARAAGQRNFQAFRAQWAAAATVDPALQAKLARYFDADGQLLSWPAKASLQQICLWVIWSRLPAREAFTEEDLNRRLRAMHRFGDHALLRREMFNQGLLHRTPDGREYRRVERRPPAEALALIAHLGTRRAA